jgi:protein-L-isoaspartate(D-aspartate) O-methyltransferase
VFCSRGDNRYKSLESNKKIPRHLFLNSSFEDYAYQDKAFPIGAGQTISTYTVAFQSQLLEIKEHKVLEIGTGSGYQTAVLCFMGAKFTASNIKWCLNKPRLLPKLVRLSTLLLEMGIRLPTYAPFDSIIVTAGHHLSHNL